MYQGGSLLPPQRVFEGKGFQPWSLLGDDKRREKERRCAGAEARDYSNFIWHG